MLGGTGTLDVSVNGHHTQTIDAAGVPRLYTLYQAGGLGRERNARAACLTGRAGLRLHLWLTSPSAGTAGAVGHLVEVGADR